MDGSGRFFDGFMFSNGEGGMTVGQRWRRRRNLLIFALARSPFSDRLLAGVFDLARSRISSIEQELSQESGIPLSAGSAEQRMRWVGEQLKKPGAF